MITYFAMNLVSRFPRSTTHNTMMYVTKKLLGKGNELSIHKLKHTRYLTSRKQCTYESNSRTFRS